MKYRFLIADSDNFFREITKKIIHKYKSDIDEAITIDALNEKLQNNKYDMLLIDTNIISNDNLHQINEIRNEYKIPVIVTTENNIDDFFEIIKENSIHIILSKPVKSDELKSVMELLLAPSPEKWFGLKNYMKDIVLHEKIFVSRSSEISEIIQILTRKMHSLGFHTDMVFFLQTIWSEILTNAVYHSHGYTREKEDGRHIILPDNRKVYVEFAATDSKFGIGVSDGEGRLNSQIILESLCHAIKQEKELINNPDLAVSTSGRGLDIIRRMSAEYYFVIQPSQNTEIISIYDKNYEKDDTYSNLKIFELPES